MAKTRTKTELVADSIWTITFGWRHHKWSHAEARALLEAYFEAKTVIDQLRVEAQRAADDAAAQRWVIEILTDELDKR